MDKDANVDVDGVVSGGTTLPAQTFTYQNDAIAQQFSPTTSGSGTSWCSPYEAIFLKTGDFNGDGKTDLLCGQHGNIRVALSNGTGFNPPVVWNRQYGVTASIVADFNNDGRTDFAFDGGTEGGIAVALSTGTPVDAFQDIVNWGVPGTCWGLYPGDFNGDGSVDLLCYRGWDTDSLIGLSSGAAFSFGAWGNLSCNGGLKVIDINADWRDDLVCNVGADGADVYLYRNNGSGFDYPGQANIGCDPTSQVWADVNGDGCTDVVCINDGRVLRATGSIVGSTAFVASAPFGAFCGGTTSHFGADVDGDGASEIVCNNAGTTADDIQVRKWDGRTLTAAATWLGGFCELNLRLGDFNGDGKTDLACENHATVAFAWAGTASWQADLLDTAANGLGGMVDPQYTSSSAFINTNNPPPKWAVTALTRSDGRGGLWTSNFGYVDGYMDRAERRFAGFRCGWEIYPANLGETLRPYDMYCFKQDAHSAGKLETSWRATGTGVYLEQRGFQYTTNGTAFPRTSLLTGESFYTYDGSGNYCSPCAASKATYTTHAYDSYGNRTQTVSYGDYYAPNDEVTSAFTFYPNPSAYIVDKPARAQVFAGVGTGGAKLSERLIYYDDAAIWQVAPAQGYPTKVEDWRDLPTSTYVATTTSYDSDGNPTMVTDPTNRSVTTAWDATYHVFPISVTNGANETVSTVWDPICGTPTSTTNPNSQVTSYQTDALCRPTLTTFPLGGFEQRQYLAFGDPYAQKVAVWTPSPTGSGNTWAVSHFDGFGRTFFSARQGPSPSQGIITTSTFNNRGGVATQTEPYYDGDTPRITSFTYDQLNRLTRTTFPDGNHSDVSYVLWSQTATDENGKSVTTTADAYGRKKQVRRFLGGSPVDTNYTYDPLGRLTGMSDHLGHSWSWTFDSLARNIQKNDPDAGTWSFAYDDAGRLTSQTDAKNQTTTFSYDALVGRLTTKSNVSETVTTSYSEPRTGFFNTGFPTMISSSASVLKLDYDAEGKVVKQVRLLDGGDCLGYSCYVLTRTYDAGAFLRSITYPDGDVISGLGYDAAGRLTLVPGIVNSVTYDASGRPLVQSNANGTTTTRTYSADRGFLTGILTTPGSPPIQNLIYTMNTPGIVGLVSQVESPHLNEGWSYGYDDLYRLTASTNTSTPAESQTWNYDAIGRITNNSRIGNYAYPSVGQARPHAPSTAGSNSYNYDPNGNLTTGAGRTLAWDANNHVTQATLGSTTTSFTYGSFGERLKKTTATSTSLYPLGDDDYEITNGVVTKYVWIDGLGIVAKRVGSGGSIQTFWHHTDRLGSVQAITDATAALVQRRTYRPYGERIADSTGHIESEGWIGERNDPETTLTYLHARYYDPTLGTFISPDPMHPDTPGVGSNRYAYSFGNPVNRLDRSGLVNCLGQDTFTDNDGNERTRDTEELCDPLEDDGPRGGPTRERGNCTNNPTHPSCQPDCTANPTAPGCTQTPDCTANPTAPGCTQTPDCTANPTAPGCTQTPDCKTYPGLPGCPALPPDVARLRDEDKELGDAPEITAVVYGLFGGLYQGWRWGYEFSFGRNWRFAPFGNRTGHPLGRWPHYHHRIVGPDGRTVPGGGIGRHRPWE